MPCLIKSASAKNASNNQPSLSSPTTTTTTATTTDPTAPTASSANPASSPASFAATTATPTTARRSPSPPPTSSALSRDPKATSPSAPPATTRGLAKSPLDPRSIPPVRPFYTPPQPKRDPNAPRWMGTARPPGWSRDWYDAVISSRAHPLSPPLPPLSSSDSRKRKSDAQSFEATAPKRRRPEAPPTTRAAASTRNVPRNAPPSTARKPSALAAEASNVAATAANRKRKLERAQPELPKRATSTATASRAEPKRHLTTAADAKDNHCKAKPASTKAAATASLFGSSDTSSDEDDTNWEDVLNPAKRTRLSDVSKNEQRADLARQLRHLDCDMYVAGEAKEAEKQPAETVSEKEGEGATNRQGDKQQKEEEEAKNKKDKKDEIKFVHAADVSSLETKCRPIFGLEEDEVAVNLRYPGLEQMERWELVTGRHALDTVQEVQRVVKYVAETYLSESEAESITNRHTGISRRLARAASMEDGDSFKAALADFNELLLQFQRDGTLARNLDACHHVPRHLVTLIVEQIYDRVVSADVDKLRAYQIGSDNVYGELRSEFVSHLLLDRCNVTSSQVFVDLGSGVGNVVLQAALETGCEAWGAEIMPAAAKLADAQAAEFATRCRMWGLRAGTVHLNHGDFRTPGSPVLAALARADVILVNNKAFTPELNDDLVHLFLELKPGARVISLRTFGKSAPGAGNATPASGNDLASNILRVEEYSYLEDWVSWTGAGGSYYVSTRHEGAKDVKRTTTAKKMAGRK